MIPRPHYQWLVEKVRPLAPLRAAFVYPCDPESLQLAVSGAFAGYLAPLLVGPEERIRDTADRAGLDIARLPIHPTADEPRMAATQAVEFARDGIVSALVKGILRNDDLLAPVVAADTGLRGERRLSHAYFLDLPGRDRELLVADAVLNFAPNLAAKKDIVHNTVDLAIALGIAAPRVAILAALDAVTPAFPSTVDAAALRKLAALGTFGPAVVDGPLAADSALSRDAALANGCRPEVAGTPDVLIAPTAEAASLVVRTLTGLSGGIAAGIVLGAMVPIIVPVRADSMEVRMASCILASLLVAAHASRGDRAVRAPAADPATRAEAA